MERMHRDFVLHRYCFQKLPSDEVDVEVRSQAQGVIDFVSTELAISSPEVVWIRPAPPAATSKVLGHHPAGWADEVNSEFARVPSDIRGGYTPWPTQLRQIWLRTGLPSRELEFAAAHETRHIWQKDHCIDIFNDEAKAEGDAYPYGYDVLRRYLKEKGCLTLEIEAEISGKKDDARAVFSNEWPDGRFEVIDLRKA